MHTLTRKLFFGCTLLLPFAATLPTVLNAQDDGPPKVLVIQREFLKPGKGGAMHDRSESAFVNAFKDAKSTTHYFAMDSVSGASRALFLSSYASFADWEKDTAAIRANKKLSENLDHASLMDGDLLSEYDSAAMTLRPDLSLNHGHLKGTRYFEITSFIVKPGHVHEFTELSKMYVDTYRKVAPDAHWDCFQVAYGNIAPSIAGGAVFVVINTMESLAETDKAMADGDKFVEALGASGMEKLSTLESASVIASSTNLFEINPRMSNPSEAWIKQDPGFWK